jgi:acetate---CoA ligase (ADP-forming)
MVDHALSPLFAPKSVALVGVSGKADSMMRLPIRFLEEFGFVGKRYIVNPRYTEIDGIPCYPTIESIGQPIDVVSIYLPANAVLEAVNDCVRASVKFIIICSSGFAEAGERGKELEASIANAIANTGTRVIGPNCQGFFSRHDHLALTFSPSLMSVGDDGRGGLAYVGHSGALGGSLVHMAYDRQMSFDVFVSVGNELDVTHTEFCDYLIEQSHITAVLLYLENLVDGRAYTALLAKAQKLGKRLIFLPTGTSVVGMRAIASHTASMQPAGTAFRTLAQRYGADVVEDLVEMLDLAAVGVRATKTAGRRIGVLSISGGGGALVADRSEDEGLVVEILDEETQTALSDVLPTFASSQNPIDVSGQAMIERTSGSAAFERAGCILAKSVLVDSIVVLLTAMMETASDLVAADILSIARSSEKPIVVIWLSGNDGGGEAKRILGQAGIPVFGAVIPALRSLSAFIRWRESLETIREDPKGFSNLKNSVDDDKVQHHPAEVAIGLDLLRDRGISTPQTVFVSNENDLESTTAQLAEPFVLKIISTELQHKSDVGGVIIGVERANLSNATKEMLEQISDLDLSSNSAWIAIQELARPGLEMIVSVTGNPQGLPPVLTIGLGGIWTESLNDIVSVGVPADEMAIAQALRTLRCWPRLSGARGRPALDVTALTQTAIAIESAFLEICDSGRRLNSIEINPLVVYEDGYGCIALDVDVNDRV